MERSLAGLLVGQKLVGRYAIEEVIGRGGMSVVYRATDERLGRAVAVKVISLAGYTDESHSDLRERLRREAASAAHIPSHPNVVQVYDHGSDTKLGVDFIAMELIRGRDLKAILKSGTLPFDEGLSILIAAANGLAAGHRVGIVHRDVKPSNIILPADSPGSAVKIVDFGIAKALEAAEEDELTQTGQTPHSPAYASPEQLRRAPNLSPASDVYQLGRIAYEVLAGARPYDPADQDRIGRGEYVPLPERGRWSQVPRAIRAVVERALAGKPEDRFQDAGEFANALESEADESTLLYPQAFDAGADEADLRPHPDRAVASEGPVRGPLRGKQLSLPKSTSLIVAGLAGAVGIWAITRGGDPAGDQPLGAVSADSAAIEATFRDLQLEAQTNLEDRADVDLLGSVQEIEQVVHGLFAAWVEGDLQAHASHYADQISYFGQGIDRATLMRERAETIENYPERDITISQLATTFPGAGQARVMLEKSWDFGGRDNAWVGASRQELELEERDGRWLVVSERDVQRIN